MPWKGTPLTGRAKKTGRVSAKAFPPTLNTQDKHAVTYAIEGNGQRQSHQGDGYAETDTMYTLNTIERNAVCFQQNQRDEVRDMGDASGALSAESGSHQQNYVCYGIDCRNASLDEEKTHTIQAKANGGISLNCTPSVLFRQTGFAGYSEGIGTLKESGGDTGGV